MSPKHKIKKKRTQLSKKQLIQIQQKLKEDISTIKEIAIEYRIAKSSIYKIKYKELSVEQRISKEKKKIQNQELDKQLFGWYQDQKEPENTTYKQLLEKAKEIRTNIGGSLKLNSLHNWLKEFIKHRAIQLKFEIYAFCCKEVEIELINWLLLEIISGHTVSHKILTAETLKLMVEFNGPLTDTARKSWLQKFKRCHKILIKFAMLENHVERYDEIKQSNKNLDDHLFNWLLERKKLGDKISLEMFADKAFELMGEFDGPSLETEEKSWLYRIKNRYKVSKSRKMFEIFQKDDEAKQSNVVKIEEEENLTAESHKLKKLENVKSFDTLQDNIDSDKIPEELTSYANAEAEGHQDTQEQQEDIKNIAENTQRENVPLIVNMMHDLNQQPESSNNLTKLLNSYGKVKAEGHQEQQDDIENIAENIAVQQE